MTKSYISIFSFFTLCSAMFAVDQAGASMPSMPVYKANLGADQNKVTTLTNEAHSAQQELNSLNTVITAPNIPILEKKQAKKQYKVYQTQLSRINRALRSTDRDFTRNSNRAIRASNKAIRQLNKIVPSPGTNNEIKMIAQEQSKIQNEQTSMSAAVKTMTQQKRADKKQ